MNLTSNPVVGRNIVRSFIVFGCIVGLVAILVIPAILGTSEPVNYSCVVDIETLGVQSTDLCSLVPEAVRQNNNVVVTGGLATYLGVIRIKGDKTVYYNVLTSGQQLDTIVKTPGPILYFEKFGYFWWMFGGVLLVPLLSIFFRIGKKLLQEKRRAADRRERQEQIQQRKGDEKELGFETVRI